MIKEHNGDIFASPANIIIHQCNCFHKMKSGIAKQISDKFPEAVDADNATKMGTDKLGDYSIAYSEDENKVIFNLYGQGKSGRTGERFTRYDALADGFKKIDTFIQNSLDAWLDNNFWEEDEDDLDDDDSSGIHNPNSKIKKFIVGIPFNIGCGLGGGDWSIVKAIIYSVFEKSPVEVLICKDPRFAPGATKDDNNKKDYMVI